MIPEEIKKEIQNIVHENVDASTEDLAYLLISKLDFGFILKKAQENNQPFDKCLDYIAGYAVNLKSELSRGR